MFTNLTNGKKYIGSSVNLSRRFYAYYSEQSFKIQLQKEKSAIYSAILKYGHSNFKLEILEYCELSDVIDREGYYFNLLKPEYNLLPIAGSSLGYKYSEEARKKMSIAQTGKNNPMYGTTSPMFGRTGDNHPRFGKSRPEGAGSPSQKIEVFDKDTNQSTIFDSIVAAARALNIHQATISKYLINNRKKPYKGRYIFIKID
jgi:group I intron endonuclease